MVGGKVVRLVERKNFDSFFSHKIFKYAISASKIEHELCKLTFSSLIQDCSNTERSGETSTLIIDIVSIKSSKFFISQLNFTKVFTEIFTKAFTKIWERRNRSVLGQSVHL